MKIVRVMRILLTTFCLLKNGKYALILLLPFVTLLYSCRQTTSNVEADKALYALDNREVVEDDSIGIEPVQRILLQTEGENELGEITKVVFIGDSIFVFDEKSRSVFLFNKNGCQLAIVNHFGAGPGEYVSINDIDVDSNGNIYAADIVRRNIIKYLAPDYTDYEEIKIGRPFLSFCIASEGIYLNNVAEGQDFSIKLAKVKSDGGELTEIVKARCNDEYKIASACKTHLWRCGDEILFYDRFSPDLYLLNGNNEKKYVSLDGLDFPTPNDVKEFVSLPVEAAVKQMYTPSSKIWDISAAYQSPRYIMIECGSFPHWYCVLDKENGKFYQLPTLTGNGVSWSEGLLGVSGDDFVTAQLAQSDSCYELVLLNIKR